MSDPANNLDDSPTPSAGVRRTHRATSGLEKPPATPPASRRGLLIVLVFCIGLSVALALYIFLKPAPGTHHPDNTTNTRGP